MADGDSGAVSTACSNTDLRARSPGRRINQQKMPAFSSETEQAVVGTEVPHPDPKFFFFMYLLSLGSESNRAHFGQADPVRMMIVRRQSPHQLWSGPEMRALPRPVRWSLSESTPGFPPFCLGLLVPRGFSVPVICTQILIMGSASKTEAC